MFLLQLFNVSCVLASSEPLYCEIIFSVNEATVDTTHPRWIQPFMFVLFSSHYRTATGRARTSTAKQLYVSTSSPPVVSSLFFKSQYHLASLHNLMRIQWTRTQRSLVCSKVCLQCSL